MYVIYLDQDAKLISLQDELISNVNKCIRSFTRRHSDNLFTELRLFLKYLFCSGILDYHKCMQTI